MKEQGSIKFSAFSAFKDLVSGISRVSNSILSVGTPGKIFPQYCLLYHWLYHSGILLKISHVVWGGFSATGNLSLESRSISNSQKDKYSYCTLQTTFTGDLLPGFKEPEINSFWFIDLAQKFTINIMSGLIPLCHSLTTILLT